RAAPTAHPRGGRAAAAWRKGGYGLAGKGFGRARQSAPQFPAIWPRCPVESGAVAFHALTGIKTPIARRASNGPFVF
ncbi:hypothetical protein ACN6RM_27020, partial [Escherichia coli]|uniref:hypothetical protein n=1 Tax=Escherichia coli TaxID=562 RepID=UPI003AFA7CC2